VAADSKVANDGGTANCEHVEETRRGPPMQLGLS
jgi:hypothetical protein